MEISTNTNRVESSATTATSSNSVDKSSEVFGSYLDSEEPLTQEEARKRGLTAMITDTFGDTSFSKALQEEIVDSIDENTTEGEFSALMNTVVILMLQMSGYLEELGRRITEEKEKGEIVDVFKDMPSLEIDYTKTNFINEFQDFLSLLEDNSITKDKELKKSYQNILKDVLEKTVEYEKQKDVALNQHLQSSQTINSFQVGA